MNKEREALARQLAASPKWRWLPGMQGDAPKAWGSFRVLKVHEGEVVMWLYIGKEGAHVLTDYSDGSFNSWSPTVPDLDDPVTAAAVVELVLLPAFREAYDDNGAVVLPNDDETEWVAWASIDGIPNSRDGVAHGPTRIEALLAAILAAPEKS